MLYEVITNNDIWDADHKQWTVDVENQPTVIKALQKNVLDKFFTVVKDEKTGLITRNNFV